MSDLRSRLQEHVAQDGRPLEALLRQHALDGLLRRLARSPHASDFLLRGGLLTRAWLGPSRRNTEDADFLGLFPRDVEEVTHRMEAVLATPLGEDDEVLFQADTLTCTLIWHETPFPGIRLSLLVQVAGTESALQIDVGFDDPVVPAPVWLDYPTLLQGPSCRVLTCRPETLIGWKLHGLFEHGIRRWRAKDLYDLFLLVTTLPHEHGDLIQAIRTAFESRDCPLTEIPPVLYHHQWWAADKALQRWDKFRKTPAGAHAPADLLGVVTVVADGLRPALGELLPLPGENSGHSW